MRAHQARTTYEKSGRTMLNNMNSRRYGYRDRWNEDNQKALQYQVVKTAQHDSIAHLGRNELKHARNKAYSFGPDRVSLKELQSKLNLGVNNFRRRIFQSNRTQQQVLSDNKADLVHRQFAPESRRKFVKALSFTMDDQLIQ